MSVSAQRKGPSAENLAKAKSLKQKYEDASVAVLASKYDIEFGFDNKTDKVTVSRKKSEKIMCIGSTAKLSHYDSYDDTSEILYKEVQYENGKKIKLQFSDDYMNVDGFFYSDSRVVYVPVNYPFQGSVRKIYFDKKYNDAKYFTLLYFHDKYPTENKTINIKVPNWLDVELKEINFDGYDIIKEKTTNGGFTNYTYTLKNIESMDKERNAPGPSYNYPHLMVLVKSHNKNGKTVELFNSTKDLYKWYKELVNGMENDPELIIPKVKEITKGKTNDLDKIKSVYYWVQDKVRYIAFEDGIAGFQPDNCQNVFKNKYGDCKGMANLTKFMLKEAGYDARLTWLGTKRIAYNYDEHPSLSTDNHMICTVIHDNKKYYLDPTEKYNTFGQYAERIQGQQVLIEDGDNFILDRIPSMKSQDNVEKSIVKLKIDEEELIGNAKLTYNGESRSHLLYNINHTETDQLDDALEHYISRKDKNFELRNLEHSDIENRDQTFELTYDYTLENAVSSFGDEIYVDLDYYKEYGQFIFEEREQDYLFRNKIKIVLETELEIPVGYKISELPEGMNEKHKDFSFKVEYKDLGSKILYYKEISIDNAIVKNSDFTKWNDCVKKLGEIYQNQLVLQKK